MPKVFYFFLLILVLAAASPVSAKVEVNISSNGGGSKSNVDVKSNYSNQIDIVLETNGVKKEYHGSDPNVSISSDDGNNSVTINGNSPKPSSNADQSTSKVTIKNNINITTDSENNSSPSSTPVAQANSEPEDKQEKKGILAMLEEFRKQLEEFFKFLG